MGRLCSGLFLGAASPPGPLCETGPRAFPSEPSLSGRGSVPYTTLPPSPGRLARSALATSWGPLSPGLGGPDAAGLRLGPLMPETRDGAFAGWSPRRTLVRGPELQAREARVFWLRASWLPDLEAASPVRRFLLVPPAQNSFHAETFSSQPPCLKIGSRSPQLQRSPLAPAPGRALPAPPRAVEEGRDPQ